MAVAGDAAQSEALAQAQAKAARGEEAARAAGGEVASLRTQLQSSAAGESWTEIYLYNVCSRREILRRPQICRDTASGLRAQAFPVLPSCERTTAEVG